MLYILDNGPERYKDEEGGGGAWGWGKAEELREQLCDDTLFGRFAGPARKIFSFPGACGTYLSKL